MSPRIGKPSKPLRFKCKKCKYSSNIKSRYERHVQNVNACKVKCFHCDLCNSSFTVKTNLYRRKRSIHQQGRNIKKIVQPHRRPNGNRINKKAGLCRSNAALWCIEDLDNCDVAREIDKRTQELQKEKSDRKILLKTIDNLKATHLVNEMKIDHVNAALQARLQEKVTENKSLLAKLKQLQGCNVSRDIEIGKAGKLLVEKIDELQRLNVGNVAEIAKLRKDLEQQKSRNSANVKKSVRFVKKLLLRKDQKKHIEMLKTKLEGTLKVNESLQRKLGEATSKHVAHEIEKYLHETLEVPLTFHTI